MFGCLRLMGNTVSQEKKVKKSVYQSCVNDNTLLSFVTSSTRMGSTLANFKCVGAESTGLKLLLFHSCYSSELTLFGTFDD